LHKVAAEGDIMGFTRARNVALLAGMLAGLCACQSVPPREALPAFVAIGADEQLATMHRGMNVLGADPIWYDPSAGRFRPAHFARLRDGGFDTVRINLHAFAHSDPSGRIDPAWLATLDRLTTVALSDGLTVILDEHDDMSCERDIVACGPRLRAVWDQLARRYRDYPNRLLFEILNEPHGKMTAEVWNGMLRDMLAVIRASNPERNVVIGPAGWSSIDQLATFDLPEDDRHIIATVHYYWPMRFTHQGASWVEETAHLSGITWGTDAERAKVAGDFDGVKAWSDAHHRPIFLGEFGAYENGDMDSRARYISSVARTAEAHGFAWASWQFETDFAAYDMKRDAWNEPILNALVP
jgi:endoglucanase